MSAQFALQPQAKPAGPSRWLRALPQSKNRSTLPMIATGAVVLVVLIQLFISVALANGAYEVESLEHTRAQEVRNQNAVSEDLVRVQSPQYIASNAQALGMVSNSNTVYLRLSDGAVLGSPSPANGSTLAGANVPNSLLTGVPLVTQIAAQQAAAERQSASASADAVAGNVPNTAGAATGQSAGGSVALQGTLPTLQTR